MEHTEILLFKTKDNLHTSRKGLESLIRKIEIKEIIIKTAAKGAIIVRIYVSPIFQIYHITEF